MDPFTKLPNELLFKITDRLDLRDLVNFGHASPGLLSFVPTPQATQAHMQRQHGRLSKQIQNVNYKGLSPEEAAEQFSSVRPNMLLNREFFCECFAKFYWASNPGSRLKMRFKELRLAAFITIPPPWRIISELSEAPTAKGVLCDGDDLAPFWMTTEEGQDVRYATLDRNTIQTLGLPKLGPGMEYACRGNKAFQALQTTMASREVALPERLLLMTKVMTLVGILPLGVCGRNGVRGRRAW
ncbi:hypothetical protein LTR97_007423 [Elasticomyces elasticus]|uniref:F-box domain-containing protein n=1 Tax=Elasticomyces elasticus TaxID=574655 RepID=A0AAN7W349_9PEZI|nr:hypothetical protein LTR97_007423 [Elasticomyces elasticus]